MEGARGSSASPVCTVLLCAMCEYNSHQPSFFSLQSGVPSLHAEGPEVYVDVDVGWMITTH